MNGVAIAHVLHRIDPSWFNEAWLGRIKEESGANWHLKVSNLKKILQSMLEYYLDVLGHQVADEHLPDINLIGEFGDVTELGKLVLGCAVSCEKKQEQIQQIITLEESVQHVVMTAIQESRKYYFLSEEAKVDLGQRCRDLEHQLATVLEERSSLQVETHSQREKLSRCDPQDTSTTITGKKLLLLQSQMEQLQEDNYRLENSRDDMRVRGEILECDVLELTHRIEELTSIAQEAQTLKGILLTGWRRWWRRTSVRWRTWGTCADRCVCWRSATLSTCNAHASWRRSYAGPTQSAPSWTPTRDRSMSFTPSILQRH